MLNAPEMVDLVDAIILADKNLTVQEICEQQGIFVGIEIVHSDLAIRFRLDNARVNSRISTAETNCQALNSLILALSGFFLFGPIKEFLR